MSGVDAQLEAMKEISIDEAAVERARLDVITDNLPPAVRTIPVWTCLIVFLFSGVIPGTAGKLEGELLLWAATNLVCGGVLWLAYHGWPKACDTGWGNISRRNALMAIYTICGASYGLLPWVVLDTSQPLNGFMVTIVLMGVTMVYGARLAAHSHVHVASISGMALISVCSVFNGDVNYGLLMLAAAPTWFLVSLFMARQSGETMTTLIRTKMRNEELVRRYDEARQAAVRASAAKSDFLAVMSHEIRTPMNGVLGLTGVLLDGDLAPHERKTAQLIRDSGENLLTIINDVLDFSKLEAGAMSLERQSVDLRALLSYPVEILSERARAKGLELTVDCTPDLAEYVWADAGRLRQILLNLVGNAIKFTETGGVRVWAQPGASPSMLRVSVIDTGIGVSPDQIDRLFQSFSQADASIARRFGGSGLGLAICKRLVELMGGRLGVNSDLGQGSEFWFEVKCEPAEKSDDAGGADASAFETAMQTIRALNRPLRVLVAEDNSTNQIVARAVLSKFGATVDVVENGAEAMAAVTRAPYDIVLMDMQMPEMDGVEATKHIRRLEGPASTVPIVALTANAFAADVETCLAAGMNGHVRKPFRKSDLAIAIAAAISGVASSRPQSEVTQSAEGAVDWSAIEAIREDSGDAMVRTLIDTFLTDAAKSLRAIIGAAASGHSNSETIRLAHSIKGAGALAGAAQLAQCASALETSLRQGVPVSKEQADELLGKFKAYCSEIRRAGLAA